MEYDPVKMRLGRFFNRHPLTRRLFYRLLDILLLRAWHIHRALRHFFREQRRQEGLHVLDAGCGFGQYTHYVARKQPAWDVHAIDLKAEEVAACQAFFARTGRGGQIRCEEADLLEFRTPNTYQLILCVDVMEHIEKDEEVFQNLHESLTPGGLLLISTPSDQGGSGVDTNHGESFIGEHVRDGYGKAEIAAKLHQAGFSKIETAYTYGRPGHWSWLLSMRIPMWLLSHSHAWLAILPLYYLLVMIPVLVLNTLDVYMHHRSGTGLLVKAWKTHLHKP